MTARTESQRLLTTGEAADLLRVSRSTVSRRFDKGELRGEVNRITGERMQAKLIESIWVFSKEVSHMHIRQSALVRYQTFPNFCFSQTF